jgi:hypothetical protein
MFDGRTRVAHGSDAHEPWLSAGLRARIARYLAKPSSPDEAPAIDGDPFTDSV